MKKRTFYKNNNGNSLVELLISTLIFSLVAGVMLSLFSMNTREFASAFYNKQDVLTSATDALTRIGLLVRSGRSFGDNFGAMPPSTAPVFDFTKLSAGVSKNLGIDTTAISAVTGAQFLVSPTFPSKGDPYYGTNSPPNLNAIPASLYGGVPPWSCPTHTLSQDTLVVQVPVFINSAGQDPTQAPNQNLPYIWPATYTGASLASITAAAGTLVKTGTAEAVDTYVFKVVADPNNTGTFAIQEAAFPANPPSFHPSNVKINLTKPATIASSIVGPFDSANKISIFSYIEKINNSDTVNPPDANYITSDYNGVIVNFEVLKQQQGAKASVASFRSEYYLRNNSQAALQGVSSSY